MKPYKVTLSRLKQLNLSYIHILVAQEKKGLQFYLIKKMSQGEIERFPFLGSELLPKRTLIKREKLVIRIIWFFGVSKCRAAGK